MSKIVLFLIFILVFCVSAISAASQDNTQKGQSTVLTALKTDELIDIDGYANEATWNDAKKLTITVRDGGIGTVDVGLQALYDIDYIYIHAEWSDPTESISKGIWTYNGSDWQTSQDEDRISFFWNIDDSIAGFNVGGCAMLCHGDRMHTNEPWEKGDIWHWKSARTNPTGYSDDKFINHTPFYDDGLWTARYPDTKTKGGYSRNINADKTGPNYHEPEPANSLDAKFILKKEIEHGDAIEINNTTLFEAGDTVPGYVLERPSGSRGDVSTGGVWGDGKWNLEFKRRLNTGNDDDVQFDITKTYRFGIAIMNNTGGFEAYGHGHSFDLGARTMEFGGLGSEEITQMALIRDYLVAAKAYVADGKTELAYSEINNALGLYNEIQNVVADEDPEHHVAIKRMFKDAKVDSSIKNIDALIEDVDHSTLILQGKVTPDEPPWNIRLLVIWGKVQIYVFILVALLAMYPIYRTIQTGKKPVFRRMSIFLLIVITPMFLEGIGRVGIISKIYFLQNFSFMTSEYATLLWAVLMFVALFYARSGFGEVDSTINSLESYGSELEQKVVERTRELKSSEEKYRSLIEKMNDGFAIIDRSNSITFANKKLGEILEHDSEDLLGKDVLSMIEEGDIDSLEEELKKGASGKASIFEVKWKTKEGRKVFTLMSASPLYSEEGNYIGYFAVITDITERRRFQQQLLQSEKLAATGQLAASIAHEINNPLSGIKNCIYILMDEIETADSKEYLDMADKELDRIARIVKQLLDFYKPTKEAMVSTDINEVMEDVLKFMEIQLDKRNIKVTKKLDKKLPKIIASGERLKQVFINLILNAQEAMPMRGKIGITTKFDHKNIKIEFKDNGYGIPEEDIENLFDPFYSTKIEGKGTGLGLSVSYGIIRAHNGMINVESKVGKGTKFIITLPIE